MGFYNDKRKSYQLIDQLYSSGKDRETIYFKVQTMFGFGKKIVDERLNLLERFDADVPGKISKN